MDEEWSGMVRICREVFYNCFCLLRASGGPISVPPEMGERAAGGRNFDSLPPDLHPNDQRENLPVFPLEFFSLEVESASGVLMAHAINNCPYMGDSFYFSWNSSICSPTGPMKKAIRAGYFGWAAMTISFGSTWMGYPAARTASTQAST